MDAFLTSEGLLALVTLTFLEIILGVDNVIFISILAGKLPAADQAKARRLRLAAAMGMRILLLLSIAAIVRLTRPLFTVFGQGISGRDLILIVGGLFLLGKATLEIHERLEGGAGPGSGRAGAARRARAPVRPGPRPTSAPPAHPAPPPSPPSTAPSGQGPPAAPPQPPLFLLS